VRRIVELIEGRRTHDLRSMAALQQDTVSLLFRELRPVLKAMRPATASARRWRLRLLVWDGDTAADSVESTVFHAWYTALSTLPADETGSGHWDRYPRYLIGALRDGDPACTRRGTSCLEFAADVLDDVLAELGEEPPPWGALHQAHLNHALLTHTPLAAMSDRALSAGGGHYTVNVGWFSPENWVMHHGPTYRQVVDMADPESSLFVMAGGQSGNPLAPGYADQLPRWQGGDYLPMRRKGYAVEHELVLLPARAEPAD
jgi:penicillin amidase